MSWLRALFYLSPLVLAFGMVTLFHEVGRLQLPGIGDALTGAIQEDIGPLNPIVPLSGTTREIRDLIYDPLLIRDDDLNLRPHIIDRWQEQTVVTIRCDSEESAGEVEAKLRSGEYLGEEHAILALDRLENVIIVALDGFESDLDDSLIHRIEPHNLGDYLLVELSLKHSIRDSFATFLNTSVEKGQIKMIDYEGDRVAYLFLKGDTDLFLRELQLYYESNLVLEPEIEVKGVQCHTSAQELILDLRQDVKWHDGKPVTANDVIFSYEEMIRRGSPLPLEESFWFVEAISIPTDFQLRILCRETPSMMMESWEKLPLFPAHLLRGKTGPERWEELYRAPVGTGPYRFIRRLQDGGVVLEANRSYFAGIPKQERIVYRKFESLEGKLLALRSNVIDTLVPDVRFSDWAQRNPGSVRQIRCLPRIQHFVAWNLEREPLQNNEIRRALAEAIDLKAVLRNTATSFQEPVKSLFFPGSPYAIEQIPLPLYDPRSSERRLEEAGFRFDPEKGTRIGKDGSVLVLKLAVNEANAEQIRLAEALAEQWSGIGVVIEIERLPWREILTERLLPRKFDAVFLSWEIPLERDRFSTWHSSSIETGGGNLFGLRNQVVDELLATLRFERGDGALGVAASQLQEQIADLQPCFFVCESGRIVWTRHGSLETARPTSAGKYITSEPGIGKAGLERVRPWWVRKTLDQMEEETPAAGGESAADATGDETEKAVES